MHQCDRVSLLVDSLRCPAACVAPIEVAVCSLAHMDISAMVTRDKGFQPTVTRPRGHYCTDGASADERTTHSALSSARCLPWGSPSRRRRTRCAMRSRRICRRRAMTSARCRTCFATRRGDDADLRARAQARRAALCRWGWAEPAKISRGRGGCDLPSHPRFSQVGSRQSRPTGCGRSRRSEMSACRPIPIPMPKPPSQTPHSTETRATPSPTLRPHAQRSVV